MAPGIGPRQIQGRGDRLMSAALNDSELEIVVSDGLAEDLAPYLGAYFPSASRTCQTVEREQARLAFEGALRSGSLASYKAGGRFEGDLGMLIAERNAWETSFLGCPVIQLAMLLRGVTYDERYPVAVALLKKWLDSRSTENQEYFLIRVPTEDVALIHALERCAFNLLVPMVTLERSLEKVGSANSNATEIELSEVAERDVPIIAEISRHAFNYGRFSVEPHLSHVVAGEMYATWFRNCCNKLLVDEVIVARIKEQTVGFIAVRCRQYGDFRVGEINLIAVASTARETGVGQALVEAGCNWAQSRVANMIVRTELPNTSAIRMYERCGFRLGGGSLYFSLWKLGATAGSI